ncbi:hypothetical protein ACK38Q_14005 [Aeromonas veronii]
MNRNIFFYVSLASFFYVGQGYATERDIYMRMSAEIQAESCTALSVNDSDLNIDLGTILLSDLNSAKERQKPITHQRSDTITFSCAQGRYANFRYLPSPGTISCKADGYMWGVSCGGLNQSVGFLPTMFWNDKDGKLTGALMYNDPELANQDRVRSIGLNEEGIGELKITEVSMNTIRERTPEPGIAEASFTISIWEP